jgi:hypothetical protein
MAGSDAPEAYVFYSYNPSMAAAVVFIVVFGISSLLHTYQLVRARTWYFIPFLIGCLCMLPETLIKSYLLTDVR